MSGKLEAGERYKLVSVGMLPVGDGAINRRFHIGIHYSRDGRLSISGVIGASASGNCFGSAGQCEEELLNPELVLAKGWTREAVQRLYDVWERWHLNDLRAECEHQRALGWREKAREEVIMYRWSLTNEAISKKAEAERAATSALRQGVTFTPDAEQAYFAGLPYNLTTHTPEYPSLDYEPHRSLYNGDKGHIETKILGWVEPAEHPDGLLCKPCPVCGYKRGTAWHFEAVPSDVIRWLFALPNAEQPCPWGVL